jgi:hypothetical protein
MANVEQQLLGYLLGALDDGEREAVEDEIQRDSQLRDQLVRLRRRLEPLRLAQVEFDPPTGLAKRACQLVTAYAGTHSEQAAIPLPVPSAVTEAAPPAGLWGTGRPWSWPDFAVVTGIVLSAVILVFPAIQTSRFKAQLLACQDHLRQLGQSLTDYSAGHRGFFPQLPQPGTVAAAGIYAPVLLRDGFLDDKRWVLCPSSPLADDPQFRVPTVDELQTAAGQDLVRLRSVMGGSYGYSLGYMEDGRYHPTRNLGRSHFALMADAPSSSLPGYQSLNHGGRGQNVLFEDGHILFLATPKTAGEGDDFFVNDSGVVAPGTHRNDSVIGTSDTIPAVLVNAAGTVD